jgi:hypothetical protein
VYWAVQVATEEDNLVYIYILDSCDIYSAGYNVCCG